VEALQTFFAAVTADAQMAFIVVLHLHEDQESHLTEVLQQKTDLPMEKAEDGTTVQAGHGYVIPPGHRLTIEDGRLRLGDLEKGTGTSTIDHFFRSLAADQGDHAVGVLLSGTGTDGTLGLRAINEAGGATMVQAPEDAGHDHMPQSAIATGLIDVTGPAGILAEKLLEYRDNAGVIQLPKTPEALPEEDRSVLQKIFSRLYTQAGHDFSGYKRSTVLRRIERRMQLHSVTSLEAYLRLLRDNEDEIQTLKKDLLITVTNFFRDPAAFEALEEQVIPAIFEQREATDSVRVWVAGCATGEEAYSIAMLLLEQADRLDAPPSLQVFATDVEGEALRAGRKGLYPRSIEEDVSAERLDQFFRPEEDYYRVAPRLRETIVFAEHDLLTDPPFSDLDLVSCRNVLIYLQPEMQRRALRRIHYGLREQGTLFLGRSETVGRQDDLFSVLDQGHNLLQARVLSTSQVPAPPLSSTPVESNEELLLSEQEPPSGSEAPTNSVPSEMAELHHEALMQDVSGLLVDEDFNVVHLTDRASEHLAFRERAPNFNVLDLVPKELRPLVQTALYRVFEKGESSRYPRVEIAAKDNTDGETRLMDLTVHGLDAADARRFAHVRLEERPTREDGEASSDGDRETELKTELQRTREQLRTTTEEYDTATEEMEAANEELLSMNEELKSKNQQLKQSKEEYQSVNEELKTTNQELEAKIESLRAANSDLENLMAATDIATLFLDRELHIQRFTPQVTELFNIRPPDVGRPLSDFTRRFKYEHLIEDTREVLRTLEPIEREVSQGEDRWFLLRLRPYRTVEETVEGAVLTFIDISRRRRLERELLDAGERVRQEIGQNLHDALSSEMVGGVMMVEAVRNQLAEAGREEAEKLGEVIEIFRASLETARNLSHELVPPALEDEPLAQALKNLCSRRTEASDVRCCFESDPAKELPRRRETAIHLYRIAQEAVMNAQRHAEASRIEVLLERAGDALQLVVRDDGTGLPDEVSAELETDEGGIGLRTMRHRAELIGGSLEFDSDAEWSTVVTCRLPLREAERS
jgi:two-component system CheB/CheR fusion protein